MTTYIVAVSGGVDSVVLLHMLAVGSLFENKTRLIVSHIDHGIRPDSDQDEQLVRSLAGQYELEYETTQLHLPESVSEDEARHKRYQWLDGLCRRYRADAVVTAHHQDDVLETICINLLRGTGWRGLASLRSRPGRHRPLLAYTKAKIIQHALEHQLDWREDSTNHDIHYARNYVRHCLLPRLNSSQRQQLLSLNARQLQLRNEIEREATRCIRPMKGKRGLRRHHLIMSGSDVQAELVRTWTGESYLSSDDHRLRRFVCTARTRDRCTISGGRVMEMGLGGELIVSSGEVC